MNQFRIFVFLAHMKKLGLVSFVPALYLTETIDLDHVWTK